MGYNNVNVCITYLCNLIQGWCGGRPGSGGETRSQARSKCGHQGGPRCGQDRVLGARQADHEGGLQGAGHRPQEAAGRDRLRRRAEGSRRGGEGGGDARHLRHRHQSGRKVSRTCQCVHLDSLRAMLANQNLLLQQTTHRAAREKILAMASKGEIRLKSAWRPTSLIGVINGREDLSDIEKVSQNPKRAANDGF